MSAIGSALKFCFRVSGIRICIGACAPRLAVPLERFELRYFPHRQRAKFSRFDVELERANFCAFDFFDLESDNGEHSADLTVTAFDEHDFVPRIESILDEFDGSGGGFDAATVV